MPSGPTLRPGKRLSNSSTTAFGGIFMCSTLYSSVSPFMWGRTDAVTTAALSVSTFTTTVSLIFCGEVLACPRAKLTEMQINVKRYMDLLAFKKLRLRTDKLFHLTAK